LPERVLTMGALLSLALDLLDRAGQFLCNRGWHAWRRYDTCEGNGYAYGTYKLCARCPLAVYDLDVPEGHPENTIIQFTPEQIAWLAELDKSFTQESR
jgi:hypothetical protein